MQAKDIMTTNVVTVTPDASVREVAKTLITHRISAAPVVDAAGKVVGLVSEGDLMRRPESGTEPHPSWWLRMVETPDEQAAEYAKTHGLTAEDVMTSNVVSVSEDTSVAEIAEILEKRHIKRVPVMAGGKLAGIVSRSNLLRALATQRDMAPLPQAGNDRELRTKIAAAIEKDLGLVEPFIGVIVRNGQVELWGAVSTENEKRAVRVAAETVAGKDKVTDNVGVLPSSARMAMWAE